MEKHQVPNNGDTNIVELAVKLRVSAEVLMNNISSLSNSLKRSNKCLDELNNVVESMNAGTPRPKV